jgi:hypothetical protein
MATLAEAADHYKTVFQKDAPDISEVPPEKEEEAATLLQQAAELNKPFATDSDFRRALGLAGS